MSKILGDVDAPQLSVYTSNEAIKILKQMECCANELYYLDDVIEGRNVYDLSGFSGNTTLIVPKNKNNKGICIKISESSDELYDTYTALNFFNKYGCTSTVTDFFSCNKDYLISELIESKTVLEELKTINEMAFFMGSSLRKFHDIDFSKMNKEEKTLFVDYKDKFVDEALNHEVGLRYYADYLHNHDYEKIKEYIEENRKLFKTDEVMVHGDFNPRNVFVNNMMVDFTDSHLGDRHYDICFSVWSIGVYLGIVDNHILMDQLRDIFLDAYGRELIDYDRYNLCDKVVCMYWQEHNEINGLKRELL